MPDPNVEPCPACERPVGTHTVDELAEHLSQLHDHDLPFEKIPETQQTIPETQQTITMCGSIVVKAAVHSSPMGSYPVLVFEFTTPEGPIPPIGLVLDDNHMRSVRTLVSQSIDAAIKATRKRRR